MEQIPVSISVVARQGCDSVLLNILDALADAGIVQTVKAGPMAF